MSWHLQLMEQLTALEGDGGIEALVLKQDAVMVTLDNGVVIELRYASPQQYSIGWLWGDAQWRIDTAPLHNQLPTFPNHLHDADGNVAADPLTVYGAPPWENVQRVVNALIENPLINAD